MSHEIYYTSAPEGLKRGSSGFCTVAATDNLPKALWDRLEALSAYRHHFSVNEGAVGGAGGTGGPAGQNPVSYAHSILSVTGRSYHVVSRICDSGVDHTQRTNAFAHHLVLDAADMQGAVGGPAWLLQQAGAMATQWDGRVGPLSARTLPRGDEWGSKICLGWAAATGDGGWGGHLADLFLKSPTRPVCVLFAPGQDLIGLLGEAIALVPAATRWNITFNTYFTSMPTSATCLWRCCLAGTPAAQLGLRYAANGLVLDLTAPERLGRAPEGPYVTLARTGRSGGAGAGLGAAAPAPRGRAAVPLVPKAPVKEESIDPEGDAEEALLEKQRAAILEAAPESGEIALAPVAGEEAQPRADSGQTLAGVSARRPTRRVADAGQVEADEAARRRRKQVMLLFGGALATMAAGTGLVYVVAQRGAPPEDMPVVLPPAPGVEVPGHLFVHRGVTGRRPLPRSTHAPSAHSCTTAVSSPSADAHPAA